MTKKIDGRANNGGKGNVGRKPRTDKRYTISPRVLKDTVDLLNAETKRLGLSQGDVLDLWAKIAEKEPKNN